MHSVRHHCVVWACVAASAALAMAQSPLPPSPPPQFRTRVDVMRVDVTVLDRRTRKPIRGLTAADFTVRVGGTVQPIQSLAQVDVPGPAAAAIQATASDVTTNEPVPTTARLVAIVMDDAMGGPRHRQVGQRVARAIVDGLGPEDRAAVVFANQTDNSQDFTSNRERLREAIASFDPLANRRFAYPNAPATVRKVREFMSRVASYRRAIFFVTAAPPSFTTGPSTSDAWFWLRDAGLKDSNQDGISATSTGSRLSHVPIHFVTTRGLTVSSSPAENEWNAGTLSRVTGGRAIVATNAPELEVPALLEELSSYYALAYQPTFPLDGALRYVDIAVNRPDVLVLPSEGAVRTARDDSDPAVRRTVDTGDRGSGLFSALAAPMMVGDLPLRATIVAAPQAGQKDHPVVLTLGLPPPASGVTRDVFDVEMLVYDGEGRRQLLQQTSQVTVPARSMPTGHVPEVVLRLQMEPGRYNVRIAVARAESGGQGPSGTAHLTVRVPDVRKDRLVVSGVVVSVVDGRAPGGSEAVRDVVPVTPTTRREFTMSELASTWMTLQQPARAADVTLTTEVLDETGGVVWSTRRTVEAELFAGGATREYREDLPLKRLGPGRFVLQITATAGTDRIQRDVAIVVTER